METIALQAIRLEALDADNMRLRFALEKIANGAKDYDRIEDLKYIVEKHARSTLKGRAGEVRE